MQSYYQEEEGDVDDEVFFSAVDLMPVEDLFGFEVWLNEPQSVEERRRNLLSQIGVGGEIVPMERVSEANGAELSSSNGDEGISVCSKREFGFEAKSRADQDDYTKEEEYEEEKEEEFDQTSASAAGNRRRIKRWWSYKQFVCSKRGLNDEEEISDVCSKVMKVKSNKKKYMGRVSSFNNDCAIGVLELLERVSKANYASESFSFRSNVDEGESSDCFERECEGEDDAYPCLARSGSRMKRWWSWKQLVSSKRELKEEDSNVYSKVIKRLVKVKSNKKKCMELTGLLVGQEIQAHKGCIWTMKFSPDGRYLATGGQDGTVRVWQVGSTKANPSSVESFIDQVSYEKGNTNNPPIVVPNMVFRIEESPIHKFEGHSNDVLDLAWSTSNFLLSCSKDKTVRLWKVGFNHCLHVFQHNNYVTCVQFSPEDENYFITGSIDGKVRIWGVATRRVVDWADVREVISSVCYRPDGKGFVVGSIHGKCWFYGLTGSFMKLEAQIHIQGKKGTSKNRITGIQCSQEKKPKVMVTSRDSKVRIFDGPFKLVRKFKGLPRSGCQMSASFTSSGKHVVSVGEDSRVYVWNYHDRTGLHSSNQRVRSETSCEYFYSQDVSVAVPWSGSDSCRSFPGQHGGCSSYRGRGRRSGGVEMLSVRSRCNLVGCGGGQWRPYAMTWPEERLSSGDHRREPVRVVPETWGMVIVTGSLDGKVSSFTNYGTPLTS